MVEARDMFVNEDLSKPENRVNVALFSLMQQDWFRAWFLKKLDLPTDAVVYPPVNRNGRRPDLKVERNGETLAWIEVELGRNENQLEDYRQQFRPDEVKAVWGTRQDEGDLSLEDIDDFLSAMTDLTPQVAVNVAHMRKLIRQGLDGHVVGQERADVSPAMKREPLVVALTDSLGDALKYATRGIGIGQIGADTVGEQGISLRVRRQNKSGLVAVFSITAGSRVIFPSKKKLKDCLRGKTAAIDDYLRFIREEMGCNVDSSKYSATPQLSLEADRDRLIKSAGKLSKLILALA